MTGVLADIHNHSDFCDGTSTPAQMAAAAYAKGFSDFGFSGHSFAAFDLPCSVRDEEGYIAEVRRLEADYAGKMRIYCGVEQDFYAPVADRSRYDYLIGSVHYIRDDNGFHHSVDASYEENVTCIKEVFGNDSLAFCQSYYQLVTENAFTYQPQQIGHFDLLVKNNLDGRLFDEYDKRYQAVAVEALASCLELDTVFELNFGGIFRGYRDYPYPAEFLLRELKTRGGRVTLAADAHQTEAVGFGFEMGEQILKSIGFGSLMVWHDGEFIEQAI